MGDLLSTHQGIGKKLFAPLRVSENTGRSIKNFYNTVLSLRSLAQLVGSSSLIMRATAENTAPMPAIFHLVTERRMHMNQNEITYLITMKLFRKMMKSGLISEEEYAVIDTKMREKYRPKIGTLFTEKSLTYPR